MPKISTYPFATPPTLSSYLIGTLDVYSKDTKNFLITDILALLGAGLYVPYTGATTNVDLGSNTIESIGFINPNGDSDYFLKADGSLDNNVYALDSDFAFYVPYTGATGNLNLGLYTATATSFIKLGGSAAQFLKANGSVDSNTYLTLVAATASFVPYTGATANISLGIRSLSGFDITASNSLNVNGPLRVLADAGTAGEVLVSVGPAGAPVWQSPADAIDAYKGSFYDVLQQVAVAVDTAYSVIFRQIDANATLGVTIANGTLGFPTRITVSHTGVYNVAFSAQLQRVSGGSSQTVDIWLSKGGVNVANTNTKLTFQANAGFLVAAWNFFIKLNAAEYVELKWATSDVNIIMANEAASAIHPVTPSAILTINQV